MERRERIHQLVNVMFKAIQKLYNEQKGEEAISNANMNGVVMFWFPENHEEKGAVHTITAGRICTGHLLASVVQYTEELQLEENKLAA